MGGYTDPSMKEVLGKLHGAVKKIGKADRRGLLKACLFLLGESKKEVPVATGNLRNSAYYTVRKIGFSHTGYVGYTALYAPIVHESPNAGQSKRPYRIRRNKAGKQVGKYRIGATEGKWKFLEDPLKQNEKKIFKLIADEIKKGLK